MNLYLIQTAKIIDENIHRDDLHLGGYRNIKLVDFNYMGAAEYEFGASRKSFQFIMSNWSEYQLFETEIKNTNGVPLQLFCHKDYKDEIIVAIKELSDSEDQDRYLKEHSFLWTHCNKTRGYPNPDDFLKRMRINNNFWWDFEHHWMAFFGVTDRVNAFTRAINNDHKFYINQAEED